MGSAGKSDTYDGKGKRLYIVTFGCQMNIRDSEFVAGVLIDNGFMLCEAMGDADVIVFNSCSVRKHAEDRLFGNIACLKGLKKRRPGLVIALMGCTAQAYGNKIIDKAPLVDIVCGTGNETDLPRLIRGVLKRGNRTIAADKVDEKRPETFPKYRDHKFKALVSISEGCDNFCSYCIVPYVRGRERSRAAKDIVREVEDLALRGFKEVLLLGQNVNSYSGIGHSSGIMNFVRLLEKLNKVKGIERIRFMTSHPKDAHVELFKAMRDLDKVCEHIHLPLQSGSERILKLMNRKYSPKRYLKLVEDYKRMLPLGSITTDIIVGFPSETESDFKKTLKVMKDAGFDSAYTFKYSPRPHTKSSELADNVPAEMKVSRLESVMILQRGISEARNRRFANGMVEALVEGINKKDGVYLSGRTRENTPVVFKGKKSLIGRLVDVKIESVTPYALRGRIIG